MLLELKPEEKGKLKRVLSVCFRTSKKEFERILSANSDFENIGREINWNQSINDVVSDVVDKTDENGLIGELLNVVLNEKPNNKSLKQLYFEKILIPIFKELNFSNLKNIFKNINDEPIKKEVIYLFQEYSKSLNEDEEKTIENYSAFLKINKNAWYCQIILKILILIVKEKLTLSSEIFNLDTEKESSLVLENFVKGFLLKILTIKNLDHEETIKDELKQWIQENCPKIEIPLEEPPNEKTANYLFIIAEPKTNKEFFLKAEFAQFENHNTNKKITEFNIELNLENPQAYSQKDFPEIIDQIIEKMSQVKKEKGITGLTTIELFVPFQLLSEDFDIQKIKDDFEDKVPIGMQYPFVVRSYDRFFKTTRTLYDSWDTEWKFLQDKRNNYQELLSQIEVVETTNINYNPCLAIKVICPFLSPEKRVDFFKNVLRKGVVFCLWTRYKDAMFINENKVEQIFENILNHQSLQDFSTLYETLKNIRSKQPEDENALGYNLGVLFDHDKIPTKPQNLSIS